MSSEKKLVALLRGAAPEVADADFTHEVLRRIRAAPTRRQARWWLIAASAAALMLFVRPRDAFTPRGPVPLRDFTVHCFSRAHGVELHDGAALVADDGLTFTVDYPVPTTLMLFAVDARHEVHWFYPAYLDASADPAAIALAGSAREMLPDGVTIDHPAIGPLQVVAIFGGEPPHVHAVEAKLASGAPLTDIFPRATVRTLSLIVTGHTR
jgi:anti-sigma factor RsiW